MQQLGLGQIQTDKSVKHHERVGSTILDPEKELGLGFDTNPTLPGLLPSLSVTPIYIRSLIIILGLCIKKISALTITVSLRSQ
jgi:hypothetical protein